MKTLSGGEWEGVKVEKRVNFEYNFLFLGGGIKDEFPISFLIFGILRFFRGIRLRLRGQVKI